MELLLIAGAAGAAGLAGYAMGKRKERREIANGYVTYHDNGQETGQYGNIHYGKTGQHNRHKSDYKSSHHHHHHHTTTTRLQ